ncbi:MAG: DUF5723 family protein [Prevotellaceae bacterium]|nr:DUF5723 family protein [Prevotellaceae bacterium]MDD7420525.1 DUF5723 family protein [Prevotellaceae bacterium]
MKRLATYMMTAAMTLCGTAVTAQTMNSAYFTGDYKYRHDLNPAYGNEQNYISWPALGNLNVSTHGNFGYGDVVMNNPMFGKGSDKKMTTFLNPYISSSDALSGFSKGNNRISGNVDITILSAGFKAFGGYNTIELGARTSFGMSLPYELFEFAKNTGNKSYDIGDVTANATAFAQLAFGHSHQIGDKLRIGAKVKFLFGGARADLKMENLKADLTADDKWTVTGKATANVSMKGFTYLESEEEYNDPQRGTYRKVDDVDIDGAGLGGFGMAFDLGGIYKINRDWTVSAAVVDLGFINWSNNMQATNRSQSFIFNGFHDTAVKSDHTNSLDNQADKYGDQIADFANLSDEGDQGSRSTGFGATVNVGCEYTLPVYRKLTFGLLSSTRINGDHTWTEGRLSANVAPLKWLDGGINVAVNSYTASMGWVLNIHPKGQNFFIGMDHLLGKTSKEFIPLSSNASVCVGFNVAW